VRTVATLAAMSRRVAVIDIGSNSIKLLVADRAGNGRIRTILTALEEARISRGISGAHPVLSEHGMSVGVAAVTRLMTAAAEHEPDDTAIVATSAVRDARNGAEFRKRVHEATGTDIRILTGDEEAELIGLGLVFDAELAKARDFLVFDLGGGSLECLEFRDRHVARSASLQLGCVRLTEKCVTDADAPFTAEDRARVTEEVCRAISTKFPLTPAGKLPAIATGGSVATARAILAAKQGIEFDARTPHIPVTALGAILGEAARLPITKRRKIPGLPAARADVLPTALTTLIEIARLAGVDELLHSGSNLRFGVAARMLGV
jgi:exopolyphosphatase/guanosine-5'-triphosphate,3'-diphosphate pyrophosphatase